MRGGGGRRMLLVLRGLSGIFAAPLPGSGFAGSVVVMLSPLPVAWTRPETGNRPARRVWARIVSAAYRKFMTSWHKLIVATAGNDTEFRQRMNKLTIAGQPDPRFDPYAPGFGTPLSELVSRDSVSTAGRLPRSRKSRGVDTQTPCRCARMRFMILSARLLIG